MQLRKRSRHRFGARKQFLETFDRIGAPIFMGAKARIARHAPLHKWHPEFRKAYRKVAGQTRTVVGRDVAGSIWIELGNEGVLTIDPCWLTIVGQQDPTN